MPRPSQGIDQALLRAGLELLPELGCAGLTVRRVAEHAGVNPAMFHYHYGSKSDYLRSLLQHQYELLYARLTGGAAQVGTPLDRLRAALDTLARFVREHRSLAARLAVDAARGEPVVREFLKTNAPRHVGLLLALLAEAELAGQLPPGPPGPPLARFAFLMGSVVAPMIIAGGVEAIGAAPAALAPLLDSQVLGDAAIAQRIELAIHALATTTARPTRKTRR